MSRRIFEFGRVSFFVVFFCCSALMLIAQEPEVTISDPADNSINISRSPVITIKTNYPLDTSSFKTKKHEYWDYPYPDTVKYDTTSRDTLIETYDNAPMVFYH